MLLKIQPCRVARAKEATIDPSNGVQGHAADHYEVLQVSRNAHPLIIAKAYRLLAAFYHPDKRDTGDKDVFIRVAEAYRVLSDPVRRATYDHRTFGIARTNGDELHDGTSSVRMTPPRVVENESQLRQGVLQVLYTTRRNRPHNPGLSLMTLAELLGCPIDLMQFTLWYLRGKKLIENVDDGDIAITVAGVDHVEANQADSAGPDGMLAMQPHTLAIEEVPEESSSA